MDPIPAQIGPCQFAMLGRLVAVRCPVDYDALMTAAGGAWEPGTRRWLLSRHRLGPVVRALRATTDPLLRWGGLDLDG